MFYKRNYNYVAPIVSNK